MKGYEESAIARMESRGSINTTCFGKGCHIPSVAICIATFRNNEGLYRLLKSLEKLEFSKVSQPDIEVFIVDNDASGLAEGIASNWRQKSPFPVHYQIEERRGIPFARNRLVNLTSMLDFIAFIDDDEEPHPHWMDELLCVYGEFNAPVVTGPVIPRFEIEPPNWALAGRFYESDRRSTGSEPEGFYTNNVLIDRKVLSHLKGPFEERMALSGGTDRLLAMQLSKAGISFIWANEAIVYEHVPSRRLTVQWYFRRRYRLGNSWVLCERFLPGDSYKARALSRVVYLVLLGLAVIVSSVWRGYVKIIRGIGYLCTAAGTLAGVFGSYQKEYARDDYRDM